MPALAAALQNIADQLGDPDTLPGLIAACTGAGKSRLIGDVLAERVPRLLPGEVIVITTPTQRLVRQLAGTARAHLAEPIAEHYTTVKWRGAARVIVCCNASAPGLAAALDTADRRVGLWIADEAHRTETPEIYRFHQGTRPAAALAVTATPYRAIERERLRLWGALLYRYAPSEALADGVLVPWRAVPFAGAAGTSLDDASLSMITRHINAGGAGPGTVNALSCDDAEAFAAALHGKGIAARPIHSRMSRAIQDQRIEDLRTGEIQVLVYPSLLCEGVDFPWLRWGCLRRPVKSKVRFIQELGRFLRVHPGKKEAVILDPLGLLEDHATRVDAALGWIEDPTPPESSGADPLDPADDLEECEGAVLVARVADALGAYARNMLYLAIRDGLIDPKLAPQAAAWRRQPATAKQRDYLARLARRCRHLEPVHLDCIRAVVKSGLLPSTGATSDLITLLKNITGVWAPGDRLKPLTAAAIDRAAVAVQAEPIYVASAQRAGTLALAVVRAGQVLQTRCKAVSAGVVLLAAEIAAIRLGAICGVRINAPRPLLLATSSRPAADRLKNLQRSSHPQIHAALTQYHQANIPHELRVLLAGETNPASSAAWRALHNFSRSRGTE